MSHILLKANVGSAGSGGGSSYLTGLTDVNIATPLDGHALIWSSGTSKWINTYAGSGSTGVSDHGLLSGLLDNDHPQYRLTSTTINFSEIGSTGHTHTESEISDLQNYALQTDLTAHTTSGAVHFTVASIDHGSVSGLLDNDHPQYALSGSLSIISGDLSSHITSGSVHFTEASIDHGAIGGLLDNDHPQYSLSSHTHIDYATNTQLDAHTGISTIHFTVGSIDHGSINAASLLDNDHPQYRLTATTIDFSEIGSTGHTHTESEISDLQDYALQTDLTAHTTSGSVHFTEASIDIANITSAHTHTESEITDLGNYVESGTSVEFASLSATGQIYSGGVDIATLMGAGGTSTISGASDTTIVSPNDGDTLQYTGGSWVSSSAATAYVNATPMPAAIHGIDAGTTWNNTIQEVLDAILYPYQTPAFTSFSIAGQSTTIEVGASAATGSITFSWATSNSSNVEPNTVDIRDITNGIYLETNIADDSSETNTYYSTTGISKSTNTSHQWRIEADDTQATTFTRNFNVYWYWRFYWGSSPTTTADESLIEGLQNSSLYNSRNRTYTCDANDYKWICYPTSFGLANSFTNGGFDFPMESPQTVSVTNSYGVTTNYYAYRSVNPTAAELDIIVG